MLLDRRIPRALEDLATAQKKWLPKNLPISVVGSQQKSLQMKKR